MKKLACGWLWLVFLLAGCSGEEYHYPSVKLEFLTAFSGNDGSLRAILTDEGDELPVVEDRTGTKIKPDTLARIISNYAQQRGSDGADGAVLYALNPVFSELPRAAEQFVEGVRTDPVEVVSLWMGRDYLNLMLEVKEPGKHKLHFAEEEVRLDAAAGWGEVYLTLYHDAELDVVAYSRRVYASVPLRQYAVEGVREVTVHFRLHTYSGEVKSYDFVYNRLE